MISAIVITKNEKDLIVACLESIKWVDEIIIADSGSTDKTLEIAKKYTKKVINCEGNDFSSWRNEALKEVSGEFVLCVDADERVLASLKDEILKVMEENTGESAWAIPRRNVILGEEKNYGGFWPDYVIRLFKKEKLKGWSGEIHEQPEFAGKLGYLKNPFIHLTHRDIDSMVLKTLKYEAFTAKYRFENNHPKMSSWRFFRILLTGICDQGIKKRGFFGGTVGVIDSLLQVFSLYISYVKLWELQLQKPLKRVYQDIDKKLIDDGFKY